MNRFRLALALILFIIQPLAAQMAGNRSIETAAQLGMLPPELAAIAGLGDLSRMVPTAPLGRGVRTVGTGGMFPPTYNGLQAALTASASGDTVVILGNTAVPASLSATINVPNGVSLIGMGIKSSTIVMPAGTPTLPTITFRGNNYCFGIGVYHQASLLGTEGGLRLCGANHEFVNCLFDANQDCITFGDTVITPVVGLITGADWDGSTTLTKTSAFTNYTWTPGDCISIYTGGTAGIYTISSATANTLVLASSIGGSASGTVGGVLAPLYHQWAGPSTFRNCVWTGWTFDFLRVNGICGANRQTSPAVFVSGIGEQKLSFYGCRFAGKSGSKWIIDLLPNVLCQNCFWDQPRGQFCLSGSGASTGGTSLGSPMTWRPTIAISSATTDSGGTTVTSSGGFAGYYWREGDTLVVDSGTGASTGTYTILTKTDNSNITIATSAGSSATNVAARIIPVYRLWIFDSVIDAYNAAGGAGLINVGTGVSSVPTGSCGVQVEIHNTTIRSAVAVSTFFKGQASANASPQASILVRDSVLPSGWALSNVNVSNGPKLRMLGTSLENAVTVAYASPITIDPNLGNTHVCTSIAGSVSLGVSANSGAFYTGQRFTVVLGSDGTGRTVTPDGTTIKGEAISVAATSTLRSTCTYRYTGSYWVQDGMPQETGY